jgi:hypothetical protein
MLGAEVPAVALKRIRFVFAFFAAVALAPAGARALPFYQLDIAGGRYDAATQTIVTSATRFTVYAYAAPESLAELAALTRTTYLSISLTPAAGPSAADLGSFRLGGTTIAATRDMRFGVPPLELGSAIGADPGDLAGHAPTFFTEQAFHFSFFRQSARYDTALHAGSGPQAGWGMFYAAFELDTSGLAPGVGLHFDLYSTRRGRGDVDIDRFAPFSHDAGTTPVAVAANVARPVPEPAAAAVFGIGIAAAASASRRRS